ncbi:MAG: TlpA disulfide reductase family protein [Victivallales bacterium]|jgi:thiol-disulfide isomerase/thioredoxin
MIGKLFFILFAMTMPFSLFALKPGDKATDLEILKWLKGNPITLDIAQGRNVLVVAFWATWAPPCIEAMPLLGDIQKKYADKGVVVVAISSEEEKLVAEFIKSRSYINYGIALDDSRKTFKKYMEGDSGIPTLFIVGKDGIVLWKGYPMELDAVLGKVTAGTFDIELQKKITLMHGELRKAMEKDSTAAMSNIAESILGKDPGDDIALRSKLYVFEKKNQPKEALAFLNNLQGKSPKHFPFYFMELSIMDKIGSPPGEKRRVYEKAFSVFKDDSETLARLSSIISNDMSFGTGSVKMELYAAKRALELLPQEAAGRKKALCLSALARAYYNAGCIEKAILVQTEAARNFAGFDEEGGSADLLKYYQEASEVNREVLSSEVKSDK